MLISACDDFDFYKMMEGETSTGALRISPISATVEVKTQCRFSASGGKPPYVFSLLSGAGSIDADTGVYTAPETVGNDVVRVTDDTGEFEDAYVTCVE